MLELLPLRLALVASLDAVRGSGQPTIRMITDDAQARARKVAGEPLAGESQDSASSAGERPRGPGLSQRWGAEGASRPRARADPTASARLCAPSLAYRLRRWVLTVLVETDSSRAISGADRWVGR